MKSFLPLLAVCLLAACVHRRPAPPSTPPPPVPPADQQIALQFLDALHRPSRGTHRIRIEAEPIGQTPKAVVETTLAARLHVMRTPKPSIVVQLTTNANKGIRNFRYNLATGRSETILEGRYLLGSGEIDVRMEIVHWPDGPRLISASFDWLNFPRSTLFGPSWIGGESFHLRPGERVFRYKGPSVVLD